MTLLVCAVAQAATPVSTTINVTATGSLGASGATVTGPATFTNGIPNGTFSATVTLAQIEGASANVTVNFTITATGSSDAMSGTITLPVLLLLGGGSGTGSATITGGTGVYGGATGSFPTINGTGSISTTTGAITLTFSGAGTITIGGGGSTTLTPTITAVQDAGGYTANIAEGSIFVVKGSNLTSVSGLSQSGFPLLTTYNSVKITFTPVPATPPVTSTDAYMVYTYNVNGTNQLAAVLPSTLAAGNYNVTVTNSGTVSAPFAAQVVKTKPGLISQDSTGSGLVVAQNYISASQLDIDRFTKGSVSGSTISPAYPGETLIAWATGMGPVPGGDNIASAGYDFTANGAKVQVLVGGMAITPFYAGRAPGLAGADQIDFTLPSNVPTGCTVSFQISVNGVVSNGTFVSIAPDATSSACVLAGFTTAQLQNFDQGGTYTSGGFTLISTTETVAQLGTSPVTIGELAGSFAKYTGFQLASAPSSVTGTINPTGCSVVQYTSSQVSVVTSAGGNSLDAGVVTVTGPAGSGLTNPTPLTETLNDYLLTLSSSTAIPGTVNGSIVAGTYTVNGAGGKDVGKFTTSVTVGAPIVVTGGLPTTVVRSQPLTLSWTGGNPNDYLQITGSAGVFTSGGVSTSTTFVCITTAGQGTFTVPSSILSQLPASTSSSSPNLEVSSGNLGTTFTAPLVAGGSINIGTFAALSGVAGQPTYQ